MKLYDHLSSGNAYKVRLMLAHLGQAYERIEMDTQHGETRTPEFLALNPNGRIPLLETDDGRRLAESNAIIYYLSEGTPFLSAERWERAQTLQWMFFEQYNHEPNIAVMRHWVAHLNRDSDPEFTQAVAEKRALGYEALDVMEQHLAGAPYFVGERYSIADIALFAYTHVAPEGGFDLAPYPAIGAWLDRVREQPNHISITFAGPDA